MVPYRDHRGGVQIPMMFFIKACELLVVVVKLPFYKIKPQTWLTQKEKRAAVEEGIPHVAT